MRSEVKVPLRAALVATSAQLDHYAVYDDEDNQGHGGRQVEDAESKVEASQGREDRLCDLIDYRDDGVIVGADCGEPGEDDPGEYSYDQDPHQQPDEIDNGIVHYAPKSWDFS